MLLMEWNGGGTRGHVSGDDEGHPTSVVCASGWGSYESGAEYAVEEVFFCPGTQKTVRESCDESTFAKLMALLEKRKAPEGRYFLPDAEREALPSHFIGDLPGWTVVHEEPSGNIRGVLLQHGSGAMMWVAADHQGSTRVSLVEGLAAQALEVEYCYLFSEEEKKRIEGPLAKGNDGLKGMRELFGPDLAPLRLLSEKTDRYNDWTRREWHVPNSGIIHIAVNIDGNVEYFYLMEKGDVYIKLNGLARF